MLCCKFWDALFTDDEGSANPAAITGNVHTVVLSVHTDKFSHQAATSELTHGVDKLQRPVVCSQNNAIEMDNTHTPVEFENSVNCTDKLDSFSQFHLSRYTMAH